MSEKKKETAEHRKFGEIAIAEGLVTQEQVDNGLSVQEKMREMGIKPKLMGEILHELGHLKASGRDRVLQIQKRKQGRFAIEGFEILEKLGQGSGGAVFKARQESLDRIVALKVLTPALAHNEGYISRFIREAQAVARLNHINVISAFEVGESSGYRYLAMEYIDGVTLATILKRGGALDEGRVLRIGIQLSRALEHAHRNNLIHRDVKPDNIIMTEDGVAKLCDLGLAKDVLADPKAAHRLAAHGTPNYISPEQARGDDDIDIRSDIYSLGATFFHMLTGEIPFSGESPAELMAKHVTERVRDPRNVRPQISEGCARVVQLMMAKRRMERPQSPTELIAVFQSLLDDREPGILAGKIKPSSLSLSRRMKRRS